MMGKTHALSGVAVATTAALVTHATPSGGAMLLLMLPGWALLPDIDHEESVVTAALGWVAWLPSRLLPHRRQTHSFFGVTFFVLTSWIAVQTLPNWVSIGWLGFLLCAGWLATLRVLKIRGLWALVVVVAIGLVYASQDSLRYFGFDVSVIPWLVGIGCLIHIFGDVLTKGGCPLFWPMKRRTAWNWFVTQSTGEFWFALVLGLIALVTAVLWFMGLVTQASAVV